MWEPRSFYSFATFVSVAGALPEPFGGQRYVLVDGSSLLVHGTQLVLGVWTAVISAFNVPVSWLGEWLRVKGGNDQGESDSGGPHR